DFGLGGLQKLLVTAVDQLGNLSADQISGAGEDLDVAVRIFLDSCRNVVLLQEEPALGTGLLEELESLISEQGYGVIEAASFSVLSFCHVDYFLLRPAAIR